MIGFEFEGAKITRSLMLKIQNGLLEENFCNHLFFDETDIRFQHHASVT